MAPSSNSTAEPGAILAELKRVLELEGRAVLAAVQRLENVDAAANWPKAVELMHQALERGGKVVVTGVGKSGKIAQKIAATLCSTGSFAVYLHPTEGLHGDLGLLSPSDVVLALSYTGNTEELIHLLPSLKRLGTPLIAITGNRQSQLGTQATVWLDASVGQEACPHNLAPTSSTTLALAIGDALAMALMRVRGFDARSFAQNHPGGSLGKKLHLKVEDVMHAGDAVAVLSPDAMMDEIVVASTRKRMGAVIIAEADRFVGLVVDGDFRRALAHREKFFELRARDVMNADPVKVLPSTMAVQALELMENRPYQISVLPVVDEAGKWKGLVRVHDLVRLF